MALRIKNLYALAVTERTHARAAYAGLHAVLVRQATRQLCALNEELGYVPESDGADAATMAEPPLDTEDSVNSAAVVTESAPDEADATDEDVVEDGAASEATASSGGGGAGGGPRAHLEKHRAALLSLCGYRRSFTLPAHFLRTPLVPIRAAACDGAADNAAGEAVIATPTDVLGARRIDGAHVCTEDAWRREVKRWVSFHLDHLRLLTPLQTVRCTIAGGAGCHWLRRADTAACAPHQLRVTASLIESVRLCGLQPAIFKPLLYGIASSHSAVLFHIALLLKVCQRRWRSDRRPAAGGATGRGSLTRRDAAHRPGALRMRRLDRADRQ